MCMNLRGLALNLALSGATAAGLAMPTIVRAQAKEPIKIGNTLPMTGSQAAYGNDFVSAMRMAVKDVNDMVMGGLSPEFVQYVIDTNTHRDLKAKMALNLWSKS